MRRLKKKIYLGLCATTLAVLSMVRQCHPSVVGDNPLERPRVTMGTTGDPGSQSTPKSSATQRVPHSLALSATPKKKYHPIRGVYNYQLCFPDVQDVQILAARQWGVRPVRDREQAEERKAELVYVGSNPYFVMDRGMSSSIPYLVPRAASLLHDIGRSYLDSLAAKGVPLHRIIVTSVLRSEKDVLELQKKNGNVSPESCHRFGTTFDIAYNRYNTVHPPGEHRREVQNDTLKWILSEVLRDFRQQECCYVKYEVKQGCFHITAR